MTNFLTTDELILALNHQLNQPIQNTVIEKKQKSIKDHSKHFNFKITRKKVFFLALIIAIFHIFSISIPLLSENRGINVFKLTTIIAVPMNQAVDSQMIAKAVRIEKVDLEALSIGDEIILYGSYNTEYYWIQEIVSIDFDLGVAQATFDGIISNTIDLDDIEGIYVEDANLIHMISYVSSNLKGYLLMLGTYVVIFSVVYIFYIRKKEDKPIA